MQESYKRSEKINSLKSEHLKDGVNPIIGVIHDKRNLDLETEKMIEKYKKEGDGISGISECNNHNKWSKEPFLYCIGTIISGIEKDTNDNISIMIHYNPMRFIEIIEGEENAEIIRKKGIEKIFRSIQNMKEKCEDKTIDCVIFGGEKGDDLYKKSIKVLSEVCSEKLGFEPVILTGPRMSREGTNKERLNETDIFFDNKNRRLHIIRSIQLSAENESYLPSDTEEQSKKWGKE